MRVSAPNPCIVQGSTAIPSDTAQDMKGTEIMMYLFHIFYYIFQTLVSDIAWNEHIVYKHKIKSSSLSFRGLFIPEDPKGSSNNYQLLA